MRRRKLFCLTLWNRALEDACSGIFKFPRKTQELLINFPVIEGSWKKFHVSKTLKVVL